jgi:enterochelin esterase-like enzyme
VLEPQSIVFFLVLVVMFVGLVWWMLTAKRLAIRVLAAFLAFLPAMTFGIAAVNRYYDYYQNWGSAVADLTNQGAPATTVTAADEPGGAGFSKLVGRDANLSIARKYGLTLRMRIHGRSSGITRTVFVFLPPQYFWAGFYQKYRFPAIELLHGYPGQPQDWITVLGVTTTLDSLVSDHRARPAVLVMPDANGGRGISLQCLNQASGPQDAAYLAQNLPDYISRELRVQQPGTGWGIAGYSEGGFCAANLGLQHGRVFSYAGVLSGYFRPDPNRLAHPLRLVSPFGGSRRAAAANTPLDELRALPLGYPIPQFWLGAGQQNAQDVRAAEDFGQLVELRQPAVTLRLVPGGHTMRTWRALLPPMLRWMTNGLAGAVAQYDSPAARARRAAQAAAAAAAAAVSKTRLAGQPAGHAPGAAGRPHGQARAQARHDRNLT